MKEKDISNLLHRYEQMLISGKTIYFDADEFEDLADYYDKLDDIETAKEIVNAGLRIHPNNEFLMLRYARFLIYEANYTAALQYLNSHFNTYGFELYLLKIECFLQLRLYEEAHQLSAEVLNDEENDMDVILSELGFLYVEAEYFDEAILYFEKSLEYNSENKDVLNDLAYAYEAKGDFYSAIQVCEQILDIDPYAFETWLMLGKLHSLNEEYDKAVDAFDFALTLDDSNINVLKLKTHCLILSDRVPEAMEVLMLCLEIAPDDEIVYLTLADCYLNIQDSDKMFSIIYEYEDKFGESAESSIKKAYAFFIKGDTETSEKLLSQIIKKNPDSININILAGNLYFRMKKFHEAEELYKNALFLKEEDNEDIIEKLISIYINQNELDQAIEHQKKLIETADSSNNQIKLALLYLEAGNEKKYKSYIHSLEEDTLISLLTVFYPDEHTNLSFIDKNYILQRLYDVFESRLLYKNIRY